MQGDAGNVDPDIKSLSTTMTDPKAFKHYHMHDIDSKDIYDTYYGTSADAKHLDELVIFPLRMTIKEIKTGRIKGDTLIDMSAGPSVFQLFPICTYFKDITILEYNVSCLREKQKWLHKEPDAYDWSHASEIVAKLEGCSDKWEEREEDLRKRVKQILKCDFTEENPTHPVILQKVDCVFNLYMVGHISKDLDTYRCNLVIISKMLKLGGRLILVGGFGASHYTVGAHKYHILNFHDEDLRKIIKDCGFCIDHMEVMESKIRSDKLYYHHLFFVSAVKKKEL
uniref:Nicotinamide N-methyltransferase n=1 Tax=Leptobrachium leishanense TaxID=445787 RepID=A0A8C5R7V6_9ANUR